jgi:ATP-dependent Lon protease
VNTVIMPKENRKDIHEIPLRVLKSMRLVLVDHMDDVLFEALADPKMAGKFAPKEKLMVYENGVLVQPDEPAESTQLPTESSDSPTP